MEIFDLKRGDVVLGTLHIVCADQPWFICEFDPTPDFESVKPLFDEELRLIKQSDALDVIAWEAVHSQINDLGLNLISRDAGTAIGEFLLHIEGQQATLRY